MATIRFRLRYANEDKIQSVYMWVCVGDSHRLKIKVPNLQIHSNQWDKSKGRVRNIKEIHNRHEINGLLDSMEFAAKKEITQIEKHTPPATFEKITAAIRKIYPTTKNKKEALSTPSSQSETTPKLNFWQFVEKYISDLTTKISENGKLTNIQTIKNYKAVKNCLKDFEAKNNKTLDFHSFDVAFINDYKSYLAIDKQNKVNTIDKNIGTLKRLLDIAHENELHENTAYKTKKEFNTKRENVDNVYLSENELTILENYDFSKNERLGSIRDWFLIGCWTGLRYSDFKSLKRENIKQNQIIIEQQKTGQKVAISLDITETIPNILAQRNGNFPPLISNQKFNKHVKEVLKMAGINENTTIYETIGGKRIGTTGEKYEFVTAHTARRTFATNLYLRRVPLSIIMAATGHKTEKEFRKYIKATDLEKKGDIKQYMK